MKNFLLILFLLPLCAFSQAYSSYNPDTLLTIKLDSAVNIQAERINVNLFIKKVMNDTSFYQAFRDMKRYDFIAENRIATFDRKNRITGKIYRKIAHKNKGEEKMKVLAESSSGTIKKKNGSYNLYTVEMFDYIFTNAYKSGFSASSGGDKAKNPNASYKDKLKTLLFSPGRPVKGVPFIGSKTQIFSANMRQYYDYSFYSGMYLDSIPVYTFRVKVKPDLSGWIKSNLMIKELNTTFDKKNMQILGRAVKMDYNNLAFSFNVDMNIEMAYYKDGETILPAKVTYKGDWNVPFKKEERATFLIVHKDYHL